MFLRKLSSISLLAKAERADADADAALAVVSKARAKAMRQRFLAARVEAEEAAERLERKADTNKLLCREAAQDCQIAVNELERVRSELQVAEKSVERAGRQSRACDTEFDLVSTAAKAARAKVPKTEGTE